MILRTPLHCLLFLACAAAVVAHAEQARMEALRPYIDGPWWQIAGDPDLGKYTTQRQQPVDFAIWQAADGTWQLWSCIRNTACGGVTRLFHGWEGKELTDTDWRPLGITMEADEKYGERTGGLQAPHVVKWNGLYYMLYGDWEHICLATSKDGKKFQRHVRPNGKTGLFTEGLGTNTRDICVLQIGDLWHGYYTAFPNQQGAVYCRTSPDLKNWSESTNVAFGGRAGVNPYAAECPHVVARHGVYYLFRTQRYGRHAQTSIYCSNDPLNFGINQDRLYYIGEMPIAAPEIIHHEGHDYIATLLPRLKGIRIAKLSWSAAPQPGDAVFDFGDAAHRQSWTVTSGDLPAVFTQSTRDRFNPPMSQFVGTAELTEGGLDDGLTGVIESPLFTIDSNWLFAFVSGGVDRDRLYVSLHDAETGEELQRVTSLEDCNELEPQTMNVSSYVGRKCFLRIVDDSVSEWGHICFGGLFKGVVPH